MSSVVDHAREQVLWQALEQARNVFWETLSDESASGTQVPPDLLWLVEELRGQGQRLTSADLVYLQEMLARRGSPYCVPLSVAQFLLCLLEDRQGDSLLDPFGGLGVLAAWLAERLPDRHVDVVTSAPAAQTLIQPLRLTNLTLHVGSMQHAPHESPGTYDAIVSIPPLARADEKRSYSTDGGQVELVGDPSLLAMADLMRQGKATAFLAVVVPPRFGWDARPNSIRRNLSRLGLHLSALLRFRPGTFGWTSLAFDLAIIGCTPHESLFVAEVPSDVAAQRELIGRLRARKPGRTPSLGRLVPPDRFNGLPALEAQERYTRLARATGLESVPFRRAVPEMRTPKRGKSGSEGFEEHPLAVYLPEMGATLATTRQEELPEKLKSYLQLVVDSNTVLPEYLAAFLNAPLGHALRESVMTGSTIPRIGTALLAESVLFLPSLAEQRLALQATQEIQRLRSGLSELESMLRDRPTEASRVLEAIAGFNHEERFSDWVETLPFPLAMILRSYHALDRTDKDRYERLLHFFEAFTEFCAAIHLSAVWENPGAWQPQRHAIKGVLNQHRLSLERASFGAWRVIVEVISKRLQSMLTDQEERSLACELYSTADGAVLEVLTSAELMGLLQRVNYMRNRWSGHGGAVTEAEAAERHALLKSDLDKVREMVGTTFLQYELIEPREAEILDGPVFRCRIRRVMGSNPLLEHTVVDLTTPAKTGALYLHNPGHDKALELVPVVQLSDSPQPAGYFYNRRERAELHMVSYQFAAQSDVTNTSEALLALLGEFAPENSNAAEIRK